MHETTNDVTLVDACAEQFSTIKRELSAVIVAQDRVIEELMMCLLADGHALIVGVPGLAKTLIVKTLAQIIDLTFSRIQFTPDLMPSDITGTEILEESAETGKRHFRFVPGPLFSNILLADEINRTPPKTQSALLQAMQERMVTAGNNTFALGPPFLVLATQNPIEQEGTYPLPEAQLDRFMLQIHINYPEFEEEISIVEKTTGDTGSEVTKVISREDIINLQRLVRRVPVARHITEAAVNLVRMTRPDESHTPEFVNELVRWGAGVRASQYMILAAKTRAVLRGRVTPDLSDLEAVALPVLSHRIVPSFKAEAEGIMTSIIVDRLIERMNIPAD